MRCAAPARFRHTSLFSSLLRLGFRFQLRLSFFEYDAAGVHLKQVRVKLFFRKRALPVLWVPRGHGRHIFHSLFNVFMQSRVINLYVAVRWPRDALTVKIQNIVLVVYPPDLEKATSNCQQSSHIFACLLRFSAHLFKFFARQLAKVQD